MNKQEYHKLKESVIHQEAHMPIRHYHYHYPENMQFFGTHWHEEAEFTYISGGMGSYIIDSQVCPLKEGDIVLIGPNLLHSGKMTGESPFVTDVFVFRLSLLDSSIPDAVTVRYVTPLLKGEVRMPAVIHPEDPGYEELKKSLFAIKQALEEKPAAFELSIKEQLLHFFLILYQNSYIYTQNITGKTHENEEKIRQVLDFIQEHFREVITIEQLADQIGFSSCHFMNLFKKYTGTTCTGFISQCRLNAAARELQESDSPVLTIAYNAGYNNISYFNRAFKKQFGMTPGEFRRS